jgi:hypothetical protein
VNLEEEKEWDWVYFILVTPTPLRYSLMGLGAILALPERLVKQTVFAEKVFRVSLSTDIYQEISCEGASISNTPNI